MKLKLILLLALLGMASCNKEEESPFQYFLRAEVEIISPFADVFDGALVHVNLILNETDTVNNISQGDVSNRCYKSIFYGMRTDYVPGTQVAMYSTVKLSERNVPGYIYWVNLPDHIKQHISIKNKITVLREDAIRADIIYEVSEINSRENPETVVQWVVPEIRELYPPRP